MQTDRQTANNVALNLFQGRKVIRGCDSAQMGHLSQKQVFGKSSQTSSERRKAAFTLAEVLITLGIIGVVAAITIPILVNNYQKQEYVVGLKKAYSEFNQALVQMAADNNCVGDLQCTELFLSTGDMAQDNQRIGAELSKYFKVTKNCGTDETCFSEEVSWAYDGHNGRGIFIQPNVYSFITADGMSIGVAVMANFPSGDDYCNYDLSMGVTGQMKQTCASISIDVNGLNRPNNYGRDIFNFYVTNGKGPALYPEGGSDDGYGPGPWTGPYSCSEPYRQGNGCAGRIIEEGWKMNY